MSKKRKPSLDHVTRQFGKAHADKADAEKRVAKFRKMFFEVIEIPETELAQQSIFYEGDDPDSYVSVMYPKWEIVKRHRIDDEEWKLIIREDPAKKTFQYINPTDKKVFQRTVVESAPDVDLDRMQAEDPELYEAITMDPPPPPRVLRPLGELEDEQREGLVKFLKPPKLINRMESPREAKPEELEALPEDVHVHDWQRDSRGDVGCTCGEYL